MKFCENLTNGCAVHSLRSAYPETFKKGHERGGTSGKFTENLTLAVAKGGRTVKTRISQMLQQTQKERKIFATDAFFVKRQYDRGKILSNLFS